MKLVRIETRRECAYYGAVLRLVWMVFCVAWGTWQFSTLENKPDATQAEVNRVICWALAPYAIGRAIARETEFQKDD